MARDKQKLRQQLSSQLAEKQLRRFLRADGTITNGREYQISILNVDDLLAIEGNCPALGRHASLKQFVSGQLSAEDLRIIKCDIETINFWREQFKLYTERESDLLTFRDGLICVRDESEAKEYEIGVIVDGFHRLAAAKLAGLAKIGAIVVPLRDMFQPEGF